MKVTMTAISKRQRARFYMYKKKGKKAKRFYIQKVRHFSKSETISLGKWTDERMMCPLKYSAMGSKSPYPGSDKIPCKYSDRGAKSQPIFTHSADQGKLPSNCLPQGKLVVIQKVKARDDEW